MEKICQLTGSFDQNWEMALRRATEGEIKDAIDSIVHNRHKIAHGEDVGLSYVTMRRYFENAVKLIELLEAQCL
jgi:glycerol dehydrogenase-like iron-containing ADH family enzyme